MLGWTWGSSTRLGLSSAALPSHSSKRRTDIKKVKCLPPNLVCGTGQAANSHTIPEWAARPCHSDEHHAAGRPMCHCEKKKEVTMKKKKIDIGQTKMKKKNKRKKKRKKKRKIEKNP